MKRIASLVVVVVLILPLAPAGAQAEGPIYIVQSGDTLSGIAAIFGTSVEALAQANGIADPSLVYPGMQLVIPGYEGVSGVLAARSVGYGETLASLGLRYGVTVDTLRRLNHVVNPGRLYLGLSVIVPEQGDSPLALSQATMILPEDGVPLLLLAARAGLRPWSLAAYNRLGARTWIVPGSPLALPGGSAPPSGIPSVVAGIEIRPDPAVQGHTQEVRIALSAPLQVEGRLGDRSMSFHPVDETTQVSLQGVHAMADPDLYDLEIRILDPADQTLSFAFSQPLRVTSAGYPNDPPLTVPPETIDPAVTGPEDELVRSIVNAVTPERLWDGSFQFPSAYTESFPSRFGSRRSYNATGYFYYHTGLDFYGGGGTEILAPAAGRVVFAGPLTVRGNTTFVDHGWGVFTGYLHQSEILVAEGDLVEPGQLIGRVGATGRVTGAHLHWEIWVGGVPVDPLEWTSSAYPSSPSGG